MASHTQTVKPKRGVTILHVETELGIVNIHLGLRDRYGRRVEAVAMLPNCYAGESRVVARRDGRFVECLHAKY